MMTDYLRFFFSCCIVSLMTACATSTEPQLYTLSKPVETAATNADTSMIKPVNKLVAVSISVPNRLRRPQLVLNTQGGAEVVMLEYDRWASAFDDELHDAIVSGIHQALGDAQHLQTKLTYTRVNVSLLSMNTLINDQVSAQFRWTLKQQASTAKTSNKHSLTCDFNSEMSTAGGVQGVVKTTQAIVQALVNHIAERMKIMRAGNAADC